VTHSRIRPTGAFAAKSGVAAPSFSIVFRMRVK